MTLFHPHIRPQARPQVGNLEYLRDSCAIKRKPKGTWSCFIDIQDIQDHQSKQGRHSCGVSSSYWGVSDSAKLDWLLGFPHDLEGIEKVTIPRGIKVSAFEKESMPVSGEIRVLRCLAWLLSAILSGLVCKDMRRKAPCFESVSFVCYQRENDRHSLLDLVTREHFHSRWTQLLTSLPS